jgi:hypothetical protein
VHHRTIGAGRLRGQSRRGFLQQLAAGAAGSAIAPTLLYATDKSGTRRPIVGRDEHTYEVFHDWGQLPAGLRYGNTHGVCEDANGHIYVHHTVHATSERHDTMVVFDEDGRFVRSWGAEYEGGAHGLHLDANGGEQTLILCDTKRGTVTRVTLDGEVIWRRGYPDESPSYPRAADGAPAVKYSPTNVAVAPNGDLFVADGYGASFITQYTADGTFTRTFGGKGTAAGQLDCPHGLTVDRRQDPPVLLVADRSNERLQTFSLDGRTLDTFDGFAHPCHFDARGTLMVVPDLFAKVTLVNERNHVVAQLGDGGAESWKGIRGGPRSGFPAGRFVCPHSACFDHAGNIFVVEWVEVGRVTKLRKV